VLRLPLPEPLQLPRRIIRARIPKRERRIFPPK
jgi:hypothetical protein